MSKHPTLWKIESVPRYSQSETPTVIEYLDHEPSKFYLSELVEPTVTEYCESESDTELRPVLWQVRIFYDDYTVTPGWTEWDIVKPRHTESVQERLKEYQDIIESGNTNCELRALYLSAEDEQEDQRRRIRKLSSTPTKLGGKVKAGPSF